MDLVDCTTDLAAVGWRQVADATSDGAAGALQPQPNDTTSGRP